MSTGLWRKLIDPGGAVRGEGPYRVEQRGEQRARVVVRRPLGGGHGLPRSRRVFAPRIRGLAVDEEYVMQMGPGREARRPHIADGFALRHALPDVQAGHVPREMAVA